MLEPKSRPDAREIPATLRDSLSARLDRLEHAKSVAQLCAVLGREFSYELLRAVSTQSDLELQSALTKLADAELILERGVPPAANYSFRHTLFQDAAYEALLKSERRELHARVAKTISERCPETAASQPELLARHWTDAGETERAIAAWIEAAAAARSRQAHREAEEGIRRALTLLATLPESPERDLREMELVSDLGSALQILRGEAAPEAVAALARCRALAQKGGNIKRQIGRYEEALKAAEEGLRFNPSELAYRPEGLVARGAARSALGHTDLAVRDFIEAIELAQHTRARLTELRAATALGKLLRSKGATQAARDVLQTIHAWFVGRSNLVEVSRASELLQELDAMDPVTAKGGEMIG